VYNVRIKTEVRLPARAQSLMQVDGGQAKFKKNKNDILTCIYRMFLFIRILIFIDREHLQKFRRKYLKILIFIPMRYFYVQSTIKYIRDRFCNRALLIKNIYTLLMCNFFPQLQQCEVACP